jgi:hypothetical protein
LDISECRPERYALLNEVFQLADGIEASVNGATIKEWSDEPLA